MSKTIMIQGTGSNVGKSLMVAGLARAFANRGLAVRPFKPQNMSNNAAVTPEGGEIGRAQALQAQAARVPAHTDMNPLLLKPQSTTGAQVVVQGHVLGVQNARDFGTRKATLLPRVMESYHRLAGSADLVLVEGAGSPAEINLRAGDIANMGFASAAGVPVILVGDIDRGGVIAQIIGTQAVLEEADARLIKAFIVNKFRGDVGLFDAGRDAIVARSGWPCLGVVPWFEDAGLLPAEDILDLASHPRRRLGALQVVVPQLPRISNFDDLDPLAAEPGVSVEIIPPGQPLPASADVVLLLGSKATIADLADLRQTGWDIDIAAHIRRGGHVLGLCGGYQMLGRLIADPHGVEGHAGTVEGLGHLEVDTMLTGTKTLALRNGIHPASGTQVSGYELHLGETDGPDCTRQWIEMDGATRSAASGNGQIKGCYMHGLFASDTFRAAWLADFGRVSQTRYEQTVEKTLDALADHLEAALDLDHLLSLAQDGPG